MSHQSAHEELARLRDAFELRQRELDEAEGYNERGAAQASLNAARAHYGGQLSHHLTMSHRGHTMDEAWPYVEEQEAFHASLHGAHEKMSENNTPT